MSIYICNAIPISVLRYCITIKWLKIKITSQTDFQANNCQGLWAVLGSAMSLKLLEKRYLMTGYAFEGM